MSLAPAPGQTIDWGWVFRWLMVGDNHPDGREGPRLRPWEIQELTLAEVVWMLEDHGPSTPGGVTPMSDAEIAAYAEWYGRLTIQEKLELARQDQLL